MSEKDQEQFMKHTPVEGAPQFDVAAFSDGDGSNERRGKRASYFRNGGASKGG